MNVKKYVRALLCLYLTLIIATDAVKGQSLKVGDTLPPELWSVPLDVINHPEGKETLTLNEYKDKLIILDFWATWCGACVATLPKMDSLQRLFEDQLQILTVTYQSGEVVSTFMQKYEKRKGIHFSLPMVVDSKALHSAFPHTVIPHYVWVDADGSIQAITEQFYLEPERIREVLEKRKIKFSTKMDAERIPLDRKMPFLINGNGGNGHNLLYQSLLTKYTEGIESRYTMHLDSSGMGNMLFTNLSLFWIYKIAYGADSLWISRNRMEINLKNPERFNYDRTFGALATWNNLYAYCYQAYLPARSYKALFSVLEADLKRMFPDIEAKIEQCEKECWVIRQIPGHVYTPSLHSKSVLEFTPEGYQLKNALVKHFVQDIDRMFFSNKPYPLIDETNLDLKIDLDIKADLNDEIALTSVLEQHGFSLKKESRKISVLVINDKNQ